VVDDDDPLLLLDSVEEALDDDVDEPSALALFLYDSER